MMAIKQLYAVDIRFIVFNSTGVVTLRQDHKICEKDKPLTPEQAQILVYPVISRYQYITFKDNYER